MGNKLNVPSWWTTDDLLNKEWDCRKCNKLELDINTNTYFCTEYGKIMGRYGNSIDRLYLCSDNVTKKINNEYSLYKPSKHWDLEISFKDLIFNNPKCKLIVDYKRHNSDNCYAPFVLSFNYRDQCILIGICEDGFVYDGSIESERGKEMNTKEGLRILYSYGKLLDSRSDFESKIIEHIDEDCINLIFDHNFTQENTSKPLTLRK